MLLVPSEGLRGLAEHGLLYELLDGFLVLDDELLVEGAVGQG